MALLGVNRGFWRGRTVLVTGHTGFKGGWLALWLADMGAEVHGLALPASDGPGFCNATRLEGRLGGSHMVDIRDPAAVARTLSAIRPEVVFHLAAQALVRHSYATPLETYATNVMGTANLLQAIRETATVKAVVNVTSDKCYENREWPWPYRENESLGGYDPYSSSKACSELLTAAWRRSFFQEAGIQVASARAGNVIGGGDWAADRLIPDFFRARDAGRALMIRSPGAIRPWQHVLEPLAGYLMLAERLCVDGQSFAEAWNFGPDEADARTVQWIVEYLCDHVPNAAWQPDTARHPHEAQALRLDSSKARQQLGWRPRWRLQAALDKTQAWYQACEAGADMYAFSLDQICQYEAA